MDYKNLGARIRKRRLYLNYTQEQLAEKADISLSFVGHIERGTRKMSIETLYSLAEALDCSADSLLGVPLSSDELNTIVEDIVDKALAAALDEITKRRLPEDNP